MKSKHYVEETWNELNYEKGLTERKIIFPIKDRESYIPLSWVKKYKFFDIDKNNNKYNITSNIINENYNPLYFMDNQTDMISSIKIKLEIAHYIKETWIQVEYSPKKITEREIILSIKDIESYTPSPWVKNYKFIDYLRISINGKVITEKTPMNESITYTNPTFDTSYLDINKTNNQHNFKTRTLTLNQKYMSSKKTC